MVKRAQVQTLMAAGVFAVTAVANAVPQLCRTYGAPGFSCDDSQAFRPGLTYAAPTALVRRCR